MDGTDFELKNAEKDNLCISSQGSSLKEKSRHYAPLSKTDGKVMSAEEMKKVYQMLGKNLASSNVS